MNISYTAELASSVQAQINEDIERTRRIGEAAYKNRQKMQQTLEQTAANTAETNSQLQQVVANQNEYIEILKQQIAMKQKQLDFDEQQLNIPESIKNGINLSAQGRFLCSSVDQYIFADSLILITKFLM